MIFGGFITEPFGQNAEKVDFREDAACLPKTGLPLVLGAASGKKDLPGLLRENVGFI